MDHKIYSLKLHRDEKGELRPIQGITPLLNMDIRVRPLTYGDSKSFESFGKSIFDWSEADRMRLINDHVIEPEIHIESVEDMMDNYDAFVIEDLVHAVLVISGLGRLYDPDAEGNVVGEEG